MTPSHIRRRAVGLILIVSLATACGGGAATAGSAASGSAAATDASSNASIAISGAASGEISAPSSCGPAISDDQSWNVIFQTDDGGWMLDATIEGTLEPGTYETGFHTPGAVSNLLFQGGGGTSFDSATASGSIKVDGGGTAARST